MAIIKCSECGKEVSDKAPQCPHCGCPVGTTNSTTQQSEKDSNPSNTVVVHGYTEAFAINSKISVYRDNAYLGEIGPAGIFQVDITQDCTLKFKCGFRTRTIQIRKGIDTDVYLSFDRFSGSLKAYVAGANNKDSIIQQKQQKSSQATLYSIIFIVLLFLLYFLLK